LSLTRERPLTKLPLHAFNWVQASNVRFLAVRAATHQGARVHCAPAGCLPGNNSVGGGGDARGGMHLTTSIAGAKRMLIIDGDEDAAQKKKNKVKLSKKLNIEQAELDKAGDVVEDARESHEKNNDFLAAACASPTCQKTKLP
jgi:hypothetical protein